MLEYLMYAGSIIIVILIVVSIEVCKSALVKKKRIDQLCKEAEEIRNTIEQRTMREYNKIGSLPIEKLLGYIFELFSRYLVLESESYVSAKDPEALQSLFARVQSSIYRCIGEDTLNSIRFYYGDTFLDEWLKLLYRTVEQNTVLNSVIQKSMTAKQVIASIKIY